MREIKFRGRRIDNGKWVYGYYHFDDSEDGFDAHYITTKKELDLHEVNPKTVGQYTGLKNKNGVEIFEGDIVEGVFPEIGSDVGVVVFRQGFQVEIFGMDELDNLHDWAVYADSIEVLGNIHDNPELLGEVKP